ncbi:MAG: hypothetical protein F6J97_24455 [Leptolyngbya sp. SIO4C1]|nr:hypothetical protein [Leptolyngbya sp. SIO4C1]
MIGYQMLPVENIPPDVNTITFLINPAYTMAGSLDGLTGSSATSQRFYKHVPKMRAQYGSLYPASFYRLQEAYDLKTQIEKQDQNTKAYYEQFNARLVDEASVVRETKQGPTNSDQVSVTREEDKPDESLTEEEQRQAEQDKLEQSKAEAKESRDDLDKTAKRKEKEINSEIQDREKRLQASEGLERWQRKMERIRSRAGKRNIVNTYVWDADGGLRVESQSFSNTVEQSIGGQLKMDAALGWEENLDISGAAVELKGLATANLTQTMTKTETRSRGMELNVELKSGPWGVEGRGVTDHNDRPALPGEKVNRYRFMSFYLAGSTQNFHDFFNYVVDPEWLASNSEEARALRQAQGKANKAWRVLHRVTYVERPALMGFGRDVRQLPPAISEEEKQIALLKGKVEKMEKANEDMARKLDVILNLLRGEGS